jgi:chaperone modulatory protein CbpM
MDRTTFCIRARLDAATLEAWIEAGYVRRELSEADLARALLVRDLVQDIGVNEEGVDVVLDLLDQLHEARGALRRALRVLAEEDRRLLERVRAAIAHGEG